MGNKVLSIPRVVLEDEVGQHFRASNLQRDVLRIIRRWHDAGGSLGLDRDEFQKTFDLVVDADKHFTVFAKGPAGQQKVDTFEVLMVYILLSSGDMMEKVDSAFSVFDFAEQTSGAQQSGSLNFDEAALMITAALHGVAKLYEHVTTVLPEAEVLWLCQSMFDMHRIPYHARIGRAQFQEWVVSNPLPHSFVQAFHEPYALSDVTANVQRRQQRHGAIFNELLTRENSDGTVDADRLLDEPSFHAALDEPSPEELSELVQMMTLVGPDDVITSERFHAVLRPWHIFNECDVKKKRFVDEKELDLLLWFQLKKRPPPEYAKSFLDIHIDLNPQGQISRLEWVTAAVTAKL